MDTFKHDLPNLFAQLGLDNSSEAIDQFVTENKLTPKVLITEAEFWSAAQANFINDCIAEDSEWSEVIDQLDVMLR